MSPRLRVGAPVSALMAAALALRLCVALRPLTKLTWWLPDDAFYDFAIASHLASGAGPTFDGFTPTNGFHPLWVALLVPIWRLSPAGDLLFPVHAAMVLGAVLDVASLFVLWRLCRVRLAFSNVGAAFAVGWLAFNPFQIMIATCGLEAPLAQLLLLLLLDEELETRWRAVPRVRWSVIAGLALLARVDLVIPIVALLAGRLWRCTPTTTALLPNVRRVLLSLCAAFAVYAPWLLYSRFTTGRWLQSSAVALPFSMAELPHVWGYETIQVWTRLRMSAFALLDAVILTFTSMGTGKAAAAMAVGGGVAAVLLRWSPGIRRLRTYWIGLALLLVAHGAVRLVFRDWYAFPFSVAYALFLGCAIHEVSRHGRRSWVPIAMAGALLAAGIDLEAHDRLRDGDYAIWRFTSRMSAATERVGDTDGAVLSYLAGGNGANLDGIVNWDALDALRSGALLDYIARADIGHFNITERYRHPRFMGRRWRERIVVDPSGWRLATQEQKDGRIVLDENGVHLGSVTGSEFLSDGWLWPERGGPNAARSVGRESEIVFVVRDEPAPISDVEIELASIELEDGSRCSHVKAALDGVNVGTLTIGPTMSWTTIHTGTLLPGRHRLVLKPNRYGVERSTRPWHEAQWREIRENALTAFDARGFTLGVIGLVALPPDGPGLAGDPTDALLANGWLSVDRGSGDPAVWAAASSAALRFRANRGESRRLVLKGIASPPSNGEAGQEVAVELNGVSLGTFHYGSESVEEREIATAGRAVRQGENDLVLRFSRRGGDPLGRAFYLFSLEWR